MTNYRFFLGAAGMANLADGIATIVWVWVATLITRDAGLIALVPVALRLPWALFAIPAGLVADRVDRRRLIVAMDLLRAAAFAAAAALAAAILAEVFLSQNEMKATPPRRARAGSLKSQTGSKKKAWRQ